MKRALFILLAAILLMQGAVVLAEKQVFAYQGDVAFYLENGLMGLQDKAGKVLHKAEFVSAEPFDKNDIAQVYLADGSQGFIDGTGNWVVKPMQADYLGYSVEYGNIMFEKLIYRKEDKIGLLSLSGEELLPAKYDAIYPFAKDKNYVLANGKLTLVDNHGNRLLDLQFDNLEYYTMFGIIRNGNEKKYYRPDGLCILRISPEGIEYRNEQGQAVNVDTWDDLYISIDYKKGYIEGEKNGKIGLMDLDGNTILEPKWLGDVYVHNNDYITVLDDKRDTYTYNKKTKELKKATALNDAVFAQDDRELTRYDLGKYWGFMDFEGNIISKIDGSYVWQSEHPASEGYIWAWKGGQIYFFDVYGNSITSKEWEEAYGFHEGLAAVKIKGKWGYINKKGETVIAPVWDDVGHFFADYGQTIAKVYKDGQPYGWINPQGELLCLYTKEYNPDW